MSGCVVQHVRGTRIVQCTTCHLATWNWDTFDPASFYDASYWQSADVGKGYANYFALAHALALTNQRRLHWLQGLLRPGQTRLLDAGCGPGYFVKAACDVGFGAAGVEVSQFAVDYARGVLGLDVSPGEVTDRDLPDRTFDLITMWDVVEHLPAPDATLRALHDRLAPGGLIVISTGDFASLVARLSGPRWHLFNLPEHLWFFTPNSLRLLLRRTGFSPLGVNYEVCWYSLRYLAERLEAMFLRRRVVSSRIGAWQGVALPVTLADVMTFVARRRD